MGKPTVQMGLVVEEATNFIAACYGSGNVPNMSTARYNIWTSKMANKKLTSAPSLKVLPPTTEAFQQHVHRAHFQAAIWRSALKPDPPVLDPQDYGWSVDANTQSLQSVSLSADVSTAPMDVLKLIRCGCSSEHPCSTARCSCYAAHLHCSIFCGCQDDNRCPNKSRVSGTPHIIGEDELADDGDSEHDDMIVMLGTMMGDDDGNVQVGDVTLD